MASTIAAALAELGCPAGAADLIAAEIVHNYLHGAGPPPPTTWATWTLTRAGVAGKLALTLARLSRAAGVAYPDLGPAAVRTALRHA